MKAKVLLLAAGAVLAVAITIHMGHEPPKDGVCPLGKAIHGK